MLILQGIAYSHPNKDRLFTDLDLVVNKHAKIALIGNNGAGKSTLLKILAGHLRPTAGHVTTSAEPYYVPQLTGQLNDRTVAAALGIEEKLTALREILGGHVTEANLAALDDDWTLEERCEDAFRHWQLSGVDPMQHMGTLSGGQKTKALLAGIRIHRPEIVLLDEPGNHLDAAGRKLLYAYIAETTDTLVVVSHDRYLLDLLPVTCTLTRNGIAVYGGNYTFYAEQQRIAGNALGQQLKDAEKALRKAKETEKEAVQRRQKLDARGRKKQEKAGLPTISLNTLRNNAEKSTSRMKGVHAEKTGAISEELSRLREAAADTGGMKMALDSSHLHSGKTLVTATHLNARFGDAPVWEQALSFTIVSGERIAVQGANGSGKTTLLKLILGMEQPAEGTVACHAEQAIYIDQEYAIVSNRRTVYEQAQRFNTGALEEHAVKTRLNRFLFPENSWDRPCDVLSGGEKMRLVLCCLTIAGRAPDLIVLDEPTNNLDMRNSAILAAAIAEYTGTLIVVSHDRYFLEQVRIGRTIAL